MLDDIRQDIRFAFRSLGKRPLLLVVPVLSLAIGIGANTTIFSIVNRFLLKAPEGIPNAQRMVEVGRGRDGRGFDSFSYPDFLDLREGATPLEGLAGYQMQMLTISRGDAGERVMGMLVSANYFDLMGVGAEMGRTFLPGEDQGPNEHPVLILGHSLWVSTMGSDPDVVGSTVYLNRQPYTVVGVAPEGFRGHIALGNVDVFVPIMQYPALNEGAEMFQQRGASWFLILGLLRDGASVEEADASVSTIFQRLAEEYPETNQHRTASVRPFGALPAVIRGPAGMFFGVLMAFVGLILLITCANVAGIFLARATGRSKEIAIRLSIGSGRGRLLRHFLAESMVVFLLGGVAGLVLALWGLEFLSTLEIPAPFPLQLDLSPDGRVILFAALLTLGSGLIFGLLPARQAVSLDLLRALKEEGGRAGSSEGRLRRGFVASQIGAALVILVAAGLLLRALQHASEIERGFTAEGAYLTFMDFSAEGIERDNWGVFQDELLARFQGEPWVDAAALAIDLPLDLGSHGTGVLPEGWESPRGDPYLGVSFNAVTPEYFSALQIPVLSGRTFSGEDRPGSENVAIVSRTMAEEVWPGESPLGRRVLWGAEGDDWVTVVGVVENVHNQLLTEEPTPFIYRPLAQYQRPETHLVIRTGLQPSTVTRQIHQGLRSLDPNLSLSPVIRLDRYTAVGLLPQRIAGSVAAALGTLALLLSGMGIYGTMAYTVSRRTRELGIRAALGADPRRVLRSVMTGAFRMALPGIVVGILLSILVGALLRSLLLGVSPLDPMALGGVALAVGGMVLLGTLVPARRAARVDPAEAIRYD